MSEQRLPIRREPPPVATRDRRADREEWTRLFGPLLNEPHEWFLVRIYNTPGAAAAAAHQARRGLLSGQPPGNYEAKARGQELYVKYTGPEE